MVVVGWFGCCFLGFLGFLGVIGFLVCWLVGVWVWEFGSC